MAPGKGTYRSAEPLRRNGSNRSEADTNEQSITGALLRLSTRVDPLVMPVTIAG